MSTAVVENPVRGLADLNAEFLEQCVGVLSSIDDATYVRRAELFGQTVGGHVRHVIEFYECLFAGMAGLIDYAARKRDPKVETDRGTAIAKLVSLCRALDADSESFDDIDVLVRPEDAGRGALRSTVGRELEAVASHTVHHFALISVLLRSFGLPVPADFGVSKATLRFRASDANPVAA